METWQVVLGVAAAVLLQVLQTIQIAIVGRKVSRTMVPPPPQPVAAYTHPFCRRCGTLTDPRELRDGYCVDCVSTGPTEPAPVRVPPPMRARRIRDRE